MAFASYSSREPSGPGRVVRPISLRQWGRRQRAVPAIETSVQCPMPRLLDEMDDHLFIGQRSRQERYALPLDPSGLDFVANATVIGEKLIVVSADGHVFFETYWDVGNLNDGQNFRIQQMNPPTALLLDRPITRRLDRAILLGNPMSGNYHHWLINCLPRIRVLSLLPELRGWPMIVQGPLHAFQHDSLEALGVKSIELFDGGRWEIANLAIPANGVFSPTEMRWVRQRMLEGMRIQRGKPRRIYVSRADAAGRRVVNETEVMAVLERYGFESLILSRLSLRDQVQAFADAEFVVGPHGAGLTNIIFGDQDLKLLELHPADTVNYCFWLTASGMAQQYGFLSGSSASSQRDLRVDPIRLDAMLGKMRNRPRLTNGARLA